jgi:hypothetical protein
MDLRLMPMPGSDIGELRLVVPTIDTADGDGSGMQGLAVLAALRDVLRGARGIWMMWPRCEQLTE